MSSHFSNRRGFLGRTFGWVAGMLATTQVLAQATGTSDPAAKVPPKADAPKLVDLNDPVAKALKYVHDKSAVDKALQVQKMGVDFATQDCANCVHYKDTTEVDGKKAGTCNMLLGKGVVLAEGWCNVWTKKA